ncbi:MAG: DUF5058 family protein [Tissierella sp.]|nr:DUF5058 family protein [Tissierella sp.]
MKYLDIANGNLLFLLTGLTILVVLLQSLLFINKGTKRAKELGIEKEIINKTITNSAIFSIIPSLPIIVMLLALSVPLGRYFPWLRLSVVGSAVYESMAANVAVVSMGLKDISDPNLTPTIFGVVLWVMSLGIIWGIVFNIFFLGKLDQYTKKAKATKNAFIPIFSGALFSGMLAVLSVPYVANTKNITGIVSFASAGIAAIIFQKIGKNPKYKVINEFSLPIALIVGMAASIIQVNLV